MNDRAAYLRLVEPHRDELRAHCHRLLGSHHDAEDALQEALLRAWRGLPGFDGRGSVRSWLYRIATNASIDTMKRRESAVAGLGEEHGWEDERATNAAHARLELELVLRQALDLLPPRQLHVLILRAVLGFSALETADLLGTTVAAVNSALQRARATLDGSLSDSGSVARLRAA